MPNPLNIKQTKNEYFLVTETPHHGSQILWAFSSVWELNNFLTEYYEKKTNDTIPF